MNFRNDINGLRALAVMSVVLFHFGVPYMEGGFVGVDIFFVISGFLMTSIIFNKLDKNKFSVLDFYVDRARRIIPALLFLCIALLGFGWLLLLPTEYQLLSKHISSSLLFLSNISYSLETSYFDVASHEKWLLHTWSLSVEWQFYIIYPLFILLLKKIIKDLKWVKLVILASALFSLLLSIFLSAKYPTHAFFLLPTRAWEMFAGGLIVLYPLNLRERYSRVLEMLGIILIVISIAFLSEGQPWPGHLALLPVVATMMIIVANRSSSWLTSNPIAQFLGTTSYSIYLWHWPIVVLLNYLSISSISMKVVGIGLSIVLGYLSYKLVEEKTKNIGKGSVLGKSWQNRQMLVLISLVGLSFSASTSVLIYKGIPNRVSEQVRMMDAAHNDNSPFRDTCFLQSGTQSPNCIFGNKQAENKFIFLGDSHALALLGGAIEALGPQQNLLFKGYSGCPTVLGVNPRSRPECGKFVRLTIDELNTKYINVPVIISNRAPLAEYLSSSTKRSDTLKISFAGKNITDKAELKRVYTQQYIETMCALTKYHKVYVIMPVPEPSIDVPKIMARNFNLYGKSPDYSISLIQNRQENRFILDVMTQAQSICGVTLINPSDFLCENNICAVAQNNYPLYYDDNHLSEKGNRLLVPMFQRIYQQ